MAVATWRVFVGDNEHVKVHLAGGGTGSTSTTPAGRVSGAVTIRLRARFTTPQGDSTVLVFSVSPRR